MNSMRVAVALLLVVSAAVFVVGVAVERAQGDHHDEASASGVTPDINAPEGSPEREAAEQGEGKTHDESKDGPEKLLGIDTESTAVLALGLALRYFLLLPSLSLGRPQSWRSSL